MMHCRAFAVAAFSTALLAAAALARADVYNLKVVTDANPDYSDLDSLVHSATSNWETDKDKMWAMFYWNHIARRQTAPMILHGKAETDPIRQFNDYGYTMCSTISGINCMIWQHMGYQVKYYDIAVHTVPEVFYDNGWHHYDNSLSTVYTLCDGKTIAGVEDIGKTMGCPASGGKEEAGHIAMYHALNGTGPDGFLEGADTIRDLRHLGEHTFQPGALKYRYYTNDGERGHRYILNLRDGESYLRSYARLDKVAGDGAASKDKYSADPAYFTPNGKTKDGKPKDPESSNPRYHIRGNGVRTYVPTRIAEDGIYKVEGANVITSLKITADSSGAMSFSTNNGMTWSDVPNTGSGEVDAKLIDEVNGAYEVLVKAPNAKNPKFETITQLNAKTQPKLNIGKNTIYVGAGDQTESIVLWPELQADRYKPMAVESVNMKTKQEHEGWNAVMNPSSKGEPGYVVFKIDAPQDITRITQGARMYVRNPKSSITFQHSFDGGKTWIESYKHTETEQPWDDIQNQVTAEIPTGTKSVLFKYILDKAGVYSIRMEADHKVSPSKTTPLEVTFNWSEVQEDYSLVDRSHTQVVESLPFTYNINVGGADQPVVRSLTINKPASDGSSVKPGYSDGKDAGGEKYVGKWATYGKNLAFGKPYTLSVPPSDNQWDAGDPDLKKLTDGRVGSSYSGGASFKEGPLWNKSTKPEITVDLGESQKCAAFRVHIHGYPFQDAIKGKVKDEVEVLTSADGKAFTSAGKFDFRLRWKDVPVNYMWTDEETFGAYNHTLVLDKPVDARFVKFAVKPSRMMVITEVQALDGVKYEPFDLKVALPKDAK
jgi:hypothetical protein